MDVWLPWLTQTNTDETGKLQELIPQTLEKKMSGLNEIVWKTKPRHLSGAPFKNVFPSNNTCLPPYARSLYKQTKSLCQVLMLSAHRKSSYSSLVHPAECKEWRAERDERMDGPLPSSLGDKIKKEDSFWLFHPFHRLELTVAPNRRRSSVSGFAFPKTMMSHGKEEGERKEKKKFGADLNRFAGGRQFVIFPLPTKFITNRRTKRKEEPWRMGVDCTSLYNVPYYNYVLSPLHT